MATTAFFLQGDNLLSPGDFEQYEFPIELAKNFQNPDIFSIPDLNNTAQIFAVSILPGTELPMDWKVMPVRQTFAAANPQTVSRILRACHIAQWRQDSCFCGRCGAKNDDIQNEAQRHCPKCGKNEFPRICPAIIVIITDNKDRILLAHNKRFKTGVYSHISGFNEAGETLEETVRREIREEVNIEVCDVEYIKSQAWPFPNSLMLGFKAHYSCGELNPDGDEIEDAKWFTKDDLKNGIPQLPAEGFLSRFLIKCWLEDNV